MESHQENNKRIAKNTLMLYSRQLLILLVTLFTVRVTLEILGADDYGLYELVAGMVTLFSFVSGTLTTATQRFFSFELGRHDEVRLKSVFSVNLLLYIAIALVLLVVLETLGLWLIQERLKIPPERYDAVLLVYHLAVASFIVTVLRTPYNAIIIAHEDMQFFAIISVVEAVMKLAIVYLLDYMQMDKLVLYGILMLAVSIIVAVSYLIVCNRSYSECQYKKLHWDGEMARDLMSFTGWTLFGQISTVFRTQAVSIMINQFFTPAVLATQSIAAKVSGAVTSFATNFNTSLYPPIIKYYASGEKKSFYNLIFIGSKTTFFLLWVIGLPLFVEMDFVLNLWLVTPPEYIVLFARLALLEALIQSVSLPLMTAARAPGKMKEYELSLGIVQILIFVATLIVYYLGAPAYSTYIIAIIANVILFFIRLYIVQGLVGLSFKEFLRKVIFRVTLVALVSASILIVARHLLPMDHLISSICVVVLGILVAMVTMFLIGLSRGERELVLLLIRKRLHHN